MLYLRILRKFASCPYACPYVQYRQVLDWAGAMHYRQGENPARWKGNLSEILSKPSKVKRVEHHRTIHYGKVAEFIAKLRQRQGMAAAALEFQILTAGRSGEVRTATWEEIDLQANGQRDPRALARR